MWERTLQDLIRGLRANKKDEIKFINQAVEEIRQEIKSKDMELKAGAVMKLTYLDMLGYDMSWASFHVVEVMSSPRFHLKSVGYLAATQSFSQDTDVLMLTTNLLKKDLSSTPFDISVTLNGLSHIVTSDLARDLHPDILAMLNHSKPHVRKRAVVALYKVFTKYPEIVSLGMPRLREKLEDPDSGVVTATVNVLCELSRQNPKDYLVLAPQLFHLLTTSSNNWTLIKIIKLFGSLTPHEPRLVAKLQRPIKDLITTTPAISLLYECVHTCIVGGMLQPQSGDALATTCVTKLAGFLQDSDQNLKYIALLALVKIVPTHPHLVAEYQNVILQSVDDQDMSIRMRALDLVSAMVNRNNLQSIVQQLLSHLARYDAGSIFPSASQSLSQHTEPDATSSSKPFVSSSESPAYRLALAHHILTICSQDTYENVTDFEWYMSVLVDLAYVASVKVGQEIRDQLVDVVSRVRAARRYAVKLMVKLLNDETFFLNASDEGSCAEVLWAAAWICGEYCSELAEPQKLLNYLLQPSISKLHSDTVAVYIQATTKVFGFWSSELAQRWDDDDLPRVKETVDFVLDRLRDFVASPDIEVQERASNTLALFTFIRADLSGYRSRPPESFAFGEASTSSFDPIGTTEPHFPKSLYLIQPLFSSYTLNPVGLTAQANIPVPDGLDLDEWIVPPPKPEKQPDGEERSKAKKSKKGKEKEKDASKVKNTKKKCREPDTEVLTASTEELTVEEKAELERKRQERLERMRDDPYYIFDERTSKAKSGVPLSEVDNIPIVRLDDLLPSAQPPEPQILREDNSGPATRREFVVDREGEMPAIIKSSSTFPAIDRPPSTQRSSPAPSSFHVYDAGDDEVPRTSTPDPIKVTRPKKKGATGAKKKRTPKVENIS